MTSRLDIIDDWLLACGWKKGDLGGFIPPKDIESFVCGKYAKGQFARQIAASVQIVFLEHLERHDSCKESATNSAS